MAIRARFRIAVAIAKELERVIFAFRSKSWENKEASDSDPIVFASRYQLVIVRSFLYFWLAIARGAMPPLLSFSSRVGCSLAALVFISTCLRASFPRFK